MKFRLFFAVLAVGSLFAADDPLQRIDAYSLEVTPAIRPTKDFFAIGTLGDHGFKTLPFMGLGLCERSHCCYEFKDGKPCTYKGSGNERGLYFFNIWAAHSLYRSPETKNYGTIKRSVNDQGRERGQHHINYFHPQTRQYVLDAAKFTVKTVLEREARDTVYIWGIDNEWEMPLDYSLEALAAWPVFLEKYYGGDLAKLNRAWKTEYQSFSEALPPKEDEYNKKPGAWLDWRRFQEEAYAGFIRDYFKAVRENDPVKRSVVSKSTQCTIEMQAVARTRALNHEILADYTRDESLGLYGIDQYGHGDRNTYEFSYLYHCILPTDPADKHFQYGVFSGELNNHAGPGWQFAQSYWRLLANGYKGGDFFHLGMPGGTADYATFALTSPDGSRRSRFFYLTRLAATIHRTEAFWRNATAAEVPRIAMLMPQRDVMLAGETGVSRWDFSGNNRLSVYTHLRNAGYWVEAIPSGKLAPGFMKRYNALFLVGAEHLSAEECKNIEAFVAGGGVLYADMRSGSFDEHHIEHNALGKVLGVNYKGVYTGIEVSPDDLWYNTEYGNVIRADGKILFDTTTAKIRNAEDLFQNGKAAAVTMNEFGKGKAFWFNTRLGALRPESVEVQVVSDFFAKYLKEGGIQPGYTGGSDRLRVEIPQVFNGNYSVAIAGVTRFPAPAGKLTIQFPAGAKFEHAFFAPAESALLQKVKFDGSTFELPEIKTAGILYCYNESIPMLGISAMGLASHPADKATAEAVPGQSFQVKVQLVNPGVAKLPAGEVVLQTLADWRIKDASVKVPTLKPGEIREFTFDVTTPENSPHFKPEFIYPLVAEFKVNGERKAVIHQTVSILLDRTKFEHLLSDNRPDSRFPRDFTLKTGATYAYNFPEGDQSFKDPSVGKHTGRAANGKALTDGLDQWDRRASFTKPEMEVVFDLKESYAFTGVNLRRGTQPYPGAISVRVSADGKTFAPAIPETPFAWDESGWSMTKAEAPVNARYILVKVTFPTPKGGNIDEIEIYGKPLASTP